MNFKLNLKLIELVHHQVTLFDSAKLKEDLNWAKISFKESLLKQKFLDKQETKNDILGVSLTLQ